MAMNSPRIRPVVQEVTHVLRRRIMHRQYPAGARLPSERALAEELGVSRMTISRALEDLVAGGIITQHVGSGSRVCLDATDRLPPGVIAVLHKVCAQPASPELTLILQGVLDTLQACRFAYETVQVADSQYDGPVKHVTREQDLPGMHNRYGGFLFIEGFCPEAILALQQFDVPLVVANMENDLPGVSATWVDHRRIACSAVELLAALGHRCIGLVSTATDHAFYGETVQGYRDGLERTGLPSNDRLISLCPTSSSLEAYVAARKLFSGEPVPTAVVAGRDLHAAGIFRAAQEQNWVIGRDLSVVGFDDTSWRSAHTTLTTFHEPCYELGSEAASLLIARMRGPSGHVEQREIPVPLILRRSAGPPAGDTSEGTDFSIRLLRQPN